IYRKPLLLYCHTFATLFLLVELWQKFSFSGKNLQPEDNLCPASRILHSLRITHQDQGYGWYNNFAFQVLDVGEEAMYEIARKIGGKDVMPSLAERLEKRGELKGKEIGKNRSQTLDIDKAAQAQIRPHPRRGREIALRYGRSQARSCAGCDFRRKRQVLRF
ncbi:MAG TPA: hypothetical protein PK013_05660, partial [Thermosynergistes sp.]|nr:hypothetical protein [Thermosynergistes sp.]